MDDQETVLTTAEDITEPVDVAGDDQTAELSPEDQAQAQAEADAGRETKRMQAFEPYERLGFLGQGLTGIMGGYGNQYQFQSVPNPTPLQTALGTGATLAGIYGAVRGAQAGQGWQGGNIYQGIKP